MNNFEKIKENLTVEELIELIDLDNSCICKMCVFDKYNCYYNCSQGIKQWLLREVENG